MNESGHAVRQRMKDHVFFCSCVSLSLPSVCFPPAGCDRVTARLRGPPLRLCRLSADTCQDKLHLLAGLSIAEALSAPGNNSSPAAAR